MLKKLFQTNVAHVHDDHQGAVCGPELTGHAVQAQTDPTVISQVHPGSHHGPHFGKEPPKQPGAEALLASQEPLYLLPKGANIVVKTRQMQN